VDHVSRYFDCFAEFVEGGRVGFKFFDLFGCDWKGGQRGWILDVRWWETCILVSQDQSPFRPWQLGRKSAKSYQSSTGHIYHRQKYSKPKSCS
jgi:hypothetical protein